jgi:streptomycin 6-kinase
MGEPGRTWVAALPELLGQLERQWSITVGPDVAGGSGSYVALARLADGSAGVVKVAVSDEGWADQVGSLERAEGRGYARLLASDQTRRAVLLERLGQPLSRSGWSPERQLGCLADTLALAWQDAGDARPPAGQDKATGLARLVRDAWTRLDRPCSERVIDQALLYAERRTAEAHLDLVVVHGDPHPGNLLSVPTRRPGAETGYVFVDPDGFVADRAYDLGVALRDWSNRLLGPDARRTAERFCAVLAERSGVAEQRIWEWGFLERVSTGLYMMDVVRGPESVARPYLDSAEKLVA